MREKRVVLIGDSIRMGYQSRVKAALRNRALILSPEDNCGSSFRIRENLAAWAIDKNPNIVHFNAGIHDLGWMPGETNPRFSANEYVRSLRIIVQRLRRETDAVVIFATTTPFLTPCDATPKARCTSATVVDRYNAAAVKLMKRLRGPVNDLNRVIHQVGLQTCLCDDKIHMTDAGNDALAAAVVRALEKHL